MSQANNSGQSDSSPTWSQSRVGGYVHGCRWAWCRLTFSSNGDLVHHVISEHVRRSVPVMRRDIPTLRRAEEGFGESIGMTGFMGGSQSGFEGNGLTNGEEGGMKDTTLSPAQLDDICHPSSLPSPPVTIPTAHSPLPLLNSTSVPTSSSSYIPDASKRSPQREDNNLSPPAAKGRAVSEQPSLPVDQHSPFETPITTHLKSALSPQTRFQTPTFTSLSSPTASPWVPPLPSSPSFDSLVSDAVGGGGIQSPHRDPFLHLSQDTQKLHSFSGSRDVVTQNVDMDVDVGNDATGEPSSDFGHVKNEKSGSISLSNKNDGSADRHVSGKGPFESKPLTVEAQSSHDQKTAANTLPSDWMDESSSQTESQPLSQSKPETFSEPEPSKPLSQFRPHFENPLPPLPAPRHLQAPRQAWYQSPLPLLRAKSRGHPQPPIVNSPSSNGTRSGSSSRSQSHSRTNHQRSNELQPQSEARLSSSTPSHNIQDRIQHGSAGNIFRSGSLQINPAGRVVDQSISPHSGARESGNTDESMVADGETPKSQSSPFYSHSSQFSSDTPDGHAFSYLQFQTQAPYQSQSLSQI